MFIPAFTSLKYTNRGQAKKQIGVSYLGGVSTSSKIAKNEKTAKVMTYVIYLAPADMSGFNVCPMATKECKDACLYRAGRYKMSPSAMDKARILKTMLYFQNREYFTAWVIDEIKSFYNKAQRLGYGFSVRINGTSDINPETLKLNGLNIFQILPYIQFYDYTKVYNRINLLTKYPNYDLTYSFSGNNWDECRKAIDNGMRIAVVFGGELPANYKGLKVVDADINDLRYLDENNVICGLRYKKVTNKINLNKSAFIITDY